MGNSRGTKIRENIDQTSLRGTSIVEKIRTEHPSLQDVLRVSDYDNVRETIQLICSRW